jgi:hypothetical protein
MAAPGRSFSAHLKVRGSGTLEDLAGYFASAAAGVRDYTFNRVGSMIILQRDYAKTWTIVLAVILFPVGLLFLLIRGREVLTITMGLIPGGAEVQLSGTGDPALIERLSAWLRNLPHLEDDGPPASGIEPRRIDCPRCAESIVGTALVCRFCGLELNKEQP